MTRDDLIESAMPRAAAIAGSFKRRMPFLEYEDLIGVAYLALVEAATRYDPTRGAAFTTYAGRRAHGALLDHLRSLDPLSRGCRAEVGRSFRATEPLPEDYEGSCTVDFEAAVLSRECRDAIARLPAREAFILTSMLADTPAPETARALGVGTSRVFQLAASAITHLTKALGR